MHQKKIFVLVGTGVIVVCGLLLSYGALTLPSSGPAASGAAQGANTVPFTTLVQSTEQKITTRANYRITSQDDLLELWQMISATGTPPTVDFTHHEVLAVFAGDPASSAVQVSRIEDGASRDVLVTMVTFDGDCAAKIPGVPYELVSVPLSTLALTHTDTKLSAACPK